ncbi:MAG: 50S ribosomal protein L25 [Acidobacteria bacterium]|nr:50S ribosomal protein L25 [Acidobacteriota bacterium]
MSETTTISLAATARQETGKNVSRRLRAAGQVPATVYGADEGPVTSAVSKRELAALIRHHGRSRIIHLDLDGRTIPVKIAALQLDPVRDTVVHADFMRVKMNEKTSFNVPLLIVGEAEGVKRGGGILDVITHHLEIRCLPGQLPESIMIDVSGLALGANIKVSDLRLSDGLEVASDGELVIATCISPRADEESPAAGPAEPEVIKKGKIED